ncbi:uncharacterized protein LOC120335375 isoform X2 [Styela clava]
MDYSDEVSDKQENKSKSKQKDSPSFKKQSGFAKLASKVTRKRSLKKDKQSKKEILDDSVFSSTEDSGNSALDQPISPADSGVSNSPPPMSGPTLVPLSKSTSKSEDSLDSGIYSRQKSCDSVDSIGSTESNGHTTDHTRPVMSYTTAGENNSKLDDTTNHQPMSAGKYDDFWREYQDIRQSIIVQDDDFDDRRSVTRTDSGGTDDEDEGDWFRQAGLADLVTTAALSQGAQSGPNEGNKENTAARLSTDSLTSMTILSTLTRPQREAVLRRITSFNRAQKSRRRPKPHINAVFPQNYGDSNTNNEGVSGKPPLAPPPSVEVTLSPTPTTENKKTSKSTSLPYNIGGFGDGEPYPRRYSEVTHRPTGTNMTDTDGHFLSTSIVSAYSTSSLEAGHVVKLDQKGYQRKEALDSIVATEPSGGIETLSIQTRSTEDTSWRDNFTEDNNNKSKQPMSYSETADQENLPNFSLVKDRLGITRISDLSAKDIGKVQSLALIELTALFDLHNIELKRRKFGKPKIKETGLFGIPLTTLLESDQKRQSNPQLRIPLVLRETITFLENNGLQDEGILRVPGSAVRIKNLKQELESKFSQTSPTVLLDSKAGWNEARTNDVAALLKQFLRELPNPLLTQEYIDAFQSCDLIPDRKQQLQALNLLIILLNDVHRDSLKLLLKFLSRVVAKEEVNKMTLNNVAMIMAPNLFMAKKQSKRGETPSALAASQDVKHAAGTSNIVRMLIKYHKLLWTVPTFMLTQVRNMNQAEQSSKKHGHGQSKDKLKIKFPGITKSKDPAAKLAKSPLTQEQQFEYEVPKGVIRVKVENHSMTSMAVQLDTKSSAGDVIGKFQKQCERRKQMQPDSDITVITNETHALYEVGGNIFERCLDPGTNMHALTKINPEATWVIKGRVDGS